MLKSKDLWLEFRKYGIKELLMHIKYKLTKDEMSLSKLYAEREKYYVDLTEAMFKDELAEYYHRAMQKNINLDNPITFTEKIQYLKLYDSTRQKAKLADKYEVRKWIEEKIGSKYLIPLLGVWDSYEDIEFDKLPVSFVLKLNSGSGMNIIVKNKNEIDYKTIKKNFSAWIIRPFEAKGLERHYKWIKKRIIAEEYIEDLTGNLYDYKFHCFNGKPIFIQCIGNRELKNHTGYQGNYDLDWNKLDWIFEDYPIYPNEIPRPTHLDEMINIAMKLAEGFKYVRVDLYDLEQQVLFGEMTFTPASGIYPYRDTWTEKKDKELGSLIKL